MDVVWSAQQVSLFAGEHADVKAWLEDPANNYPDGPVGDTTSVQCGGDATHPYSMFSAAEYLAMYDFEYPNG